MRAGSGLFLVCILLAYGSFGQGRKAAVKKDAVPEERFELSIDSANFCTVLTQLLGEGAKNFDRIKGEAIESTTENTIYSSKRGLPGAVTVNVVNENDTWSFQTVVYEGASKGKMTAVYAAYRRLVDKCMTAQGYTPEEKEADCENTPVRRYSKTKGGAPYVFVTCSYGDFNSVYSVSVSINNK